MNKFRSLETVLLDSGLFEKEQLVSTAESIKVIPLFEDGHEGYKACELRYSASYEIGDFKLDQDTNIFFVVVAGYLQEFDNDRNKNGLEPPEVNVDGNGNGTAELSIDLDFIETLWLKRDDEGIFTFYGKKYSIGQEAPVDVTEMEVVPGEPVEA